MEIVQEEGEISDRLNRYFQSVFIKPQDCTEDYQLPSPLTCITEEICITYEGIFNQLLLIDTKKTTGLDGILTVFCDDIFYLFIYFQVLLADWAVTGVGSITNQSLFT